ncbi:hypothetical protein Taro_018057 [Colocasia esculenta]|uniref:Uncharacterized protein n=1 Tax=Colocasia esculenta TaxID=4460 RepID=A0A843UQF0_COLES|nr:hypothetical protein [Colocasia esculenta]
MNFDVPYEDMVREARLDSSSGRRLSSGRGSSMALASGPSVPPPLALVYASSSYGSSFWSFCTSSSSNRIESSHASYVSNPYDRSGQFSPPTVAGPSAFAPPVFLAGPSTVLEAEDAVSLQEGGRSHIASR